MRAQQLIKPGLMAFTLARDHEKRCWRLKGQSSGSISKVEKLRCEDAWQGSLSVGICTTYKNKTLVLLAVLMNFCWSGNSSVFANTL